MLTNSDNQSSTNLYNSTIAQVIKFLKGKDHRFTPSRIIELTISLVFITGFITIAVAVLSGDWQIRPILSGSMEPGFSIGGVVITQTVPTSSLKVGDVAVFYPPFEHSASYVHRIVTLTRKNGISTITTKGDANLTPDPWTINLKGNKAYLARFTIPFIGYAAVWIHSPTGRKYLLLVVIILVILLGLSVYKEGVKKKHLRKTKTRIKK